MSIKEIFTKKHSQISDLEEISKTGAKNSNNVSSLESDDLKAFDELMQDYQKAEEVDKNKKAAQEIEKLLTNKSDKDKAKIKDLSKVEENQDKVSSIANLQYFTYVNSFNNKETSHKINLDSISESDLNSLKKMIENPNATITHLNQQNLQVNFSTPEEAQQISYKSTNFSKTLFNLIEYSYKTQKPIRLDFNNESSVILKIDKEGKISAEFLASSKGMETLLKDNLQNLRNKFDSEGIAYKDITYRDNSKKQKQKENKGG